MENGIKETTKATSEAVDLVVDAAGQMFEHWGYRTIVGKIWATLLLCSPPMDTAALREMLGISTGALSMGLNELIELGLVYRETMSGKRRFYYRVETDFWIVATRIFRERERKRLETVLDQIKKAEQILASNTRSRSNGKDIAFQLEQVQRLVNIGEFAIDLLDAVMERTRVELKAAQKWLSVSGKIGGEPLSRIRRAINAGRMGRNRRQ